MIDLKARIAASRSIVILTGAGVSVPSGIPDYRSENGLYADKASPEYLLSRDCLEREPAKLHHFVISKMYYPDAVPNIIHQKIAALEQEKEVTVITQNIDGLHDQAGSKSILHFHGNLQDVYCERCQLHVPFETYQADYIHQDCGGLLRPNIVLYGEEIDEGVIRASIQKINFADLILIVGTSFQVSPFCNLTEFRNAKAEVVAINKDNLQLPFDFQMIQADAAEIFADL